MTFNGFNSLCKDEHQAIIVSKDNGTSRRHIAHNIDKDMVGHYRVDGKIITSGRKCDFLLLNETKKDAYLIELKGKSLEDAAEQLERSELLLHPYLKAYSVHYRIVASKVKTQAVESIEFKKFRAKLGQALKYKTQELTENI